MSGSDELVEGIAGGQGGGLGDLLGGLVGATGPAGASTTSSALTGSDPARAPWRGMGVSWSCYRDGARCRRRLERGLLAPGERP
jgi:hypothetical protein